MSKRIVITHGTIVDDAGEQRADLVIDDQEVVAVLGDAEGVDADETIDASDLLVLPAGIDTWFDAPWLRDPKRVDDALALQRASVAGGWTTLATVPEGDSGASGAQTNIAADIVNWYPIVGHAIPTADQLARMVQTGIVGFSATMRPEGEPDTSLTDGELLAVLKSISRMGVPLSISAHHADIDPSDPLGERAAVTTCLLFAESTGAWIHFRNVSTPEAIDAIAESRARGARVTLSVSALHLALPLETAARDLRSSPPLRQRAHQDALWRFVMDETVDCISTQTVWKRGQDASAMADVQTALPLFWHEAVEKRGMSRMQAVRMLASNPARMLGLARTKGSIRIGTDADLVLFDPYGEWTVHREDLLAPNAWSPIDDRAITGFVVRTLRRGSTVYDADRHDDETLLGAGSGTLLKRAS